MSRPVVLVDAYNVMRSRWPNLAPDRFVGLAQAWAQREDVRLLVVFDGAAPGDVVGRADLDERVTLVGAGGGSADDWIVREGEELAAERAATWLVTSDRLLRQRTAPFASRTIGGGAFARQLADLDPLE